jgi:hypothetical protein
MVSDEIWNAPGAPFERGTLQEMLDAAGMDSFVLVKEDRWRILLDNFNWNVHVR